VHAPQHLWISGLDAPGDHPAAATLHQAQHLWIAKVHAAVARPADLEATIQQALANAHDVLTVYCEQIGVHVDAAQAQRRQLLDLRQDVFGRAPAHGTPVGDMLDAELAICRAAPARHYKGIRAVNHRGPVSVQREQIVAWERQCVQISDQGTRLVYHRCPGLPPRQAGDAR